MQNNRTIPIMCRVDKATKGWIDSHPLSQSDLINYGLHLIMMVEQNITHAQTHITSISLSPAKQDLPF